MFDENIHHGLRIVDVVVGIEFEFLEFRIFAHEIFDGVFKRLHDFGELGLARWCFNVDDDFMINSQFLGDRQGIVRRASMIEMVDRDFGHAGNLGERNEGATAI